MGHKIMMCIIICLYLLTYSHVSDTLDHAICNPFYIDMYEHASGGGESKRLYMSDTGCYPLNDWNDRISSINTHGQCIMVWDLDNCTGDYIKMAPGVGCHHDFSGCYIRNRQSLNKRVSSVSSCNIMPTPKIPSQGISIGPNKFYIDFYEHPNYGGKANRYIMWSGICHDTNGWWDDRISSVDTHGHCVIMWEHKNCKGDYMELPSGVGCSRDFQRYEMKDGRSWDSKVSSVSACNYAKPISTTFFIRTTPATSSPLTTKITSQKNSTTTYGLGQVDPIVVHVFNRKNHSGYMDTYIIGHEKCTNRKNTTGKISSIHMNGHCIQLHDRTDCQENPHGHCLRLYDQLGCQGNRIDINYKNPCSRDLSMCNFDNRALSMSFCSYSDVSTSKTMINSTKYITTSVTPLSTLQTAKHTDATAQTTIRTVPTTARYVTTSTTNPTTMISTIINHTTTPKSTMYAFMSSTHSSTTANIASSFVVADIRTTKATISDVVVKDKINDVAKALATAIAAKGAVVIGAGTIAAVLAGVAPAAIPTVASALAGVTELGADTISTVLSGGGTTAEIVKLSRALSKATEKSQKTISEILSKIKALPPVPPVVPPPVVAPPTAYVNSPSTFHTVEQTNSTEQPSSKPTPTQLNVTSTNKSTTASPTYTSKTPNAPAVIVKKSTAPVAYKNDIYEASESLAVAIAATGVAAVGADTIAGVLAGPAAIGVVASALAGLTGLGAGLFSSVLSGTGTTAEISIASKALSKETGKSEETISIILNKIKNSIPPTPTATPKRESSTPSSPTTPSTTTLITERTSTTKCECNCPSVPSVITPSVSEDDDEFTSVTSTASNNNNTEPSSCPIPLWSSVLDNRTKRAAHERFSGQPFNIATYQLILMQGLLVYNPVGSPIQEVYYAVSNGINITLGINAIIYPGDLNTGETFNQDWTNDRMTSLDAHGYGNNFNIVPKDDKGHLLAVALGGPAQDYNLVPQSPLLNRAVGMWRGEGWADQEIRAVKWLRELRRNNCDGHVEWKVAINYDLPNRRPKGFKLEIRLYYTFGKVDLPFNIPITKYYSNEINCYIINQP